MQWNEDDWEPAKTLMIENRPDVHNWLVEVQPQTEYGVVFPQADSYSILTLTFVADVDEVIFKLAHGDVFVNPQQVHPTVIKRYF